MSAYANSVDVIEESMHKQFNRVKDSLRDDHARRTTRVRELVTAKDVLAREIDGLLDEINREVGDMHAFMARVREEIRRAGTRPP